MPSWSEKTDKRFCLASNLGKFSLAMGMKISKPVTGLLFGIVAIDPCFIANNNVSQKVYIWFFALTQVSGCRLVILLLFGCQPSWDELCHHTSHAQTFIRDGMTRTVWNSCFFRHFSDCSSSITFQRSMHFLIFSLECLSFPLMFPPLENGKTIQKLEYGSWNPLQKPF